MIEEIVESKVNKSFGLDKSSIKDYIEYYKTKYSLNDIDSILNEIESFLSSTYTTSFGFDENGELIGIENFPNQIWLYRIIDNSYEKINQDCLGISWTYDEEWLENEDFQNSVGFVKNKPYYKVKALFRKEDLDVDSFPELFWQLSHERELRLKNACIKPIKYTITKFNKHT